MNILYIDHYAGSLDLGMEFRPYYLAREWQKLGHKVRIIGASFSHLRVKQPEVKKDFEIQVIDGIEYQWVKTITYDHNGSARAISMFQFCVKLWWNAKQIAYDFKPDVVIGSSTYTFDTYPCQRIARLSWAKYIHENHDLWPLTLTTIGHMSKYHPFVLLNAAGLKSALKNADQIVCVLPFAYEYFREFGFTDMNRFHHIPNGVVKEDWENPEPLPKEHEELFVKLKDKFIIGYLGTHGLSNNLEVLIDVAEMMKKQSDCAFVFVGNGIAKERLIQRAKSLHCENVYFLPGVSKKIVPTVLKKFDVANIGGHKSDLEHYGISVNKIYDYMMAAVPIVIACYDRNEDIVKAGCGYMVESDNVEALYNALNKVKRLTVEERKQRGINGRKWVLENCEYSVLADKFLNVMKQKERTK